MSRKILALLTAALLVLALAGCSTAQEIKDKMQGGGRSSGNTHTATAPETQTNSFFALTVNDAYMVASLDGYYPEYVDGAFLVVDITVEDVLDTDSPMPMFTTDFLLGWEGCAEPEVAYAKFSDDQLEDQWEMNLGEKVSGKLVFDCPANETEFTITFQEVWDDEFEGDTYVMNFTADTSTYQYVAPEANGRSTGNIYTAGVGEAVQNAFFTMTVDKVEKVSEVEGYGTGIDGMDFLILDVTIQNTFGDVIDMFTSDFTVEWGTGDEDWDPGFVKSFEDQLEDEWTMADGETVSGKLYFAVPAEKEEFRLAYTEVWADSFIGDTYLVDLAGGRNANV